VVGYVDHYLSGCDSMGAAESTVSAGDLGDLHGAGIEVDHARRGEDRVRLNGLSNHQVTDHKRSLRRNTLDDHITGADQDVRVCLDLDGAEQHPSSCGRSTHRHCARHRPHGACRPQRIRIGHTDSSR
jgi:hypothetical protein